MEIKQELLDVSLEDLPLEYVSICSSGNDVSSLASGVDRQLIREAVTTAEIFRHATLLYLFRIMNGDNVPLDDDTILSVRKSLDLLSSLQNIGGPASVLGWNLVTIGSELETSEDREYIRSKWPGLHSLGLSHSFKAQELLEEVWRRRDVARQRGTGSLYPHWQDVMADLGWTLFLS